MLPLAEEEERAAGTRAAPSLPLIRIIFLREGTGGVRRKAIPELQGALYCGDLMKLNMRKKDINSVLV